MIVRIRPQFVGMLLIVLTSIFAVESQAQSNQRRVVYLEISADARARVGAQQQWLEMLQGVGADRVVSKTLKNGRVGIEETEMKSATVVKVSGVIAGDRLKLPGGSFTIRDKSGIRELLKRLRDDGAQVAMAEKKAFGLTSKQLVTLHGRLSQTVDFDTKGKKAGDVTAELIKKIGVPFVLDSAARAAVNGNEVILDELKGLSVGTALAAVVRPLGLVIEPKREQGKQLEIHLQDSRQSQENWPIGWPLERVPVAVAPTLFDKIPLEIRNFPLQAVLNAIEKKSGVNFLIDYNTLARKDVDLATTKVTLVEKKVVLLVAVSNALKQSKPRLSCELRIDENAKPFLWITSK
ncbi:MAG: hypothetical protein ACKVHR_04275 [Pirellulales bacterium]|jgi:hypothetical protein